jgi:HAD superfamily hydrolase (TIGR01490 family)
VSTTDPQPPADQPRAPAALRAAAFFDVDRTLVSGSSGFAILIEMMRAGIVTRRQLASGVVVSARFRLWGLDDATTDAVRLRVSGYVAGVSTDRLTAISDAVLQRVLPRVYPEILTRAHAHQDAGEPAYLITASTQEFADLFAEVLDFDGAVGSRSEIVAGRYTGRPGGPFIYGDGKVTAMQEIAAQAGIDLARSTAYSDSISDLPMLRAVGTAVAVNPDRALREIAENEGWEVLALDQLGRRLAVAGASAGVVGLAALAGRWSAGRRRTRSAK